MAPKKRLGHGNVLKLDTTAIACVRNFTPPAKTRDEIDVTCTDDTIMDYLDSDPPDQGVLVLDLVWEPGETNGTLLDTLFDNSDSDARDANWHIEWNNTSNTLVKDSFSGRILDLTPAQVENKQVVSRKATIRLTSAITRVVTP